MKILDLYCGAGGASWGYHLANPEADIVGVDINPQPDYPFEFRQANALNLDEYTNEYEYFDLTHASPPCQHFTKYRNVHKDITDRYEDLIEPTRQILLQSGMPYIMENVPKAPIRCDLELCGTMFDIDVRRHRWFELEGLTVGLTPPHQHERPKQYKSSTGRKNLRMTIEIGAWDEPFALQKKIMGMEWVTDLRQLSEAIPPAYTKFILENATFNEIAR